MRKKQKDTCEQCNMSEPEEISAEILKKLKKPFLSAPSKENQMLDDIHPFIFCCASRSILFSRGGCCRWWGVISPSESNTKTNGMTIIAHTHKLQSLIHQKCMFLDCGRTPGAARENPHRFGETDSFHVGKILSGRRQLNILYSS